MTLPLNELIQAVASGLNEAARKPSIHNYIPNPGGQLAFHQSESIGRLLAGDNRSGKTVAGAVEAAWWLTGRHPFISTPDPPIYGRCITVDFDYGADQIIIPKLKQWIPPSELINSSWEASYSNKKHILKLRNGSELEIKSHKQELDSFAGVPRHFLWCDEEPPRGIFIESKTRLIDYNGRYWITMTPVEGMTWVYDELVEKDTKNVAFFSIDIKANPHIPKEAIEALAADLDDEETAIRLGGGGKKNFVPRGGLVFKEFNYDRHAIDSGYPPTNWTYYTSVDHGFNNYTAWLWHAVSPRQSNGAFYVVTFAEHYRREWTISMHAQRVHEIEKELGREIFLRIGDPSMSQRVAETGHSALRAYALEGLRIKPGKKHKDNVNIDRMNDYFRTNRWYVTKDCPNFIKELRKLPWKRYQSQKITDMSNKREEPLAKDDHACDSAGYFARFMPDLTKDAEVLPVNPGLLNKLNPGDYPWRHDLQLMYSTPVATPERGWGEV